MGIFRSILASFLVLFNIASANAGSDAFLKNVIVYSDSKGVTTVLFQMTLEQLGTIEYEEVDLLKVTSDAMDGMYDLKALVDGDMNILGIRAYKNGDAANIDLEKLAQGIVMFKSQGFDVISLKSSGFNPASGGLITLTYLSNGITKSYEDFPMELLRVENRWALKTKVGEEKYFSSMFLKKRTILGQTIGIEEVTVQ